MKTMTIAKDIKYDRGGSRDSQFQIWRLSRIAENKKLSITAAGIRQKSPIRLTDADLLQDEIMFPPSPLPRKTRSLHLSLKQTKILTTLLPNAIINISDLSKDSMDTFVGVLMFADVSGFTALCEKYNGLGKSGSEKLTATLNNYLGAMVEVIYKHGGDVLKFSGDALLALWKLEKNEYMYSLIHRVICSALYIQTSMGIYETDVKVLLKVKLAISAGNMTFSVIGNDESRHYLVVGQPVHEVKLAEQVCTSGEVVLSLSAWGHLSPVNYEHYWKDREHVKIIRVIYNPESSKREILRCEVKGSFHKIGSHHHNGLLKETSKKRVATSSSAGEIRALVEDASNKKFTSDLRTFLIPSVIQQIDADLPMEYLCEMRNVTVMFINIVPNRLQARRLISMVDKAYVITCSLAYKAMGSVNKVSLFDKDVMVLVIFGLRGFSHEGEVAACLKCGYDIRQACCSLDGVLNVSIGVTTGKAYCGVVGHPLRREYTVIGAVVNKAARIMCAYPGKVTCDRDTFMFSNLAASFFTIQEKKYLKGIEDTGPIYEFTLEKSKNTLAAMQEGMYPILGREKEIHIFNNILQSISASKSWEKAVVVRGPGRIGKTRLLDEMILEAHKKGFVPIAIALHTVHSTLAYGTAQSIIKQVLDIPDSASTIEKEEKLSAVLKNHVPTTDYWYINEVMNVKFPRNGKEETLSDSVEKLEKIKKLFHVILTMGTKSVIFAIDDVDYCDELSWKLIMSVIENRIKFLIMTMPKRLRPGTAQFLKFPPEIDAHILKMTLLSLPNDLLASLACQILNARAIPIELERILITRSNGNPGWCESFLISLSQSNILKVEELPEWYIKSLGLIVPPESDLRRTQYAASYNQSDPNFEHENLRPRSENLEVISRTKKKQYVRKRKTAHRIKLVRFSRENSGLRINSKFEKPQNSFLQIEEAYEDLRQRIQLVRTQSRLFTVQPSDENLKSELYEEAHVSDVEDGRGQELLQEIELEKIKEDESDESYRKVESPQVSHSSVSVDDKIFGTLRKQIAENVEDLEIDTDSISLKEKIYMIRRRLSSKPHSSTPENFGTSPDLRGEPVLKSLIDLRGDREVSPLSKSKSAEPLLNRKEVFMVDVDVPNINDISRPGNEKTEFSPSSLWKSHTQELIDESVKIFIREKTKSERGKVLEKCNFRKKNELADSVSVKVSPFASSICTRSPEDSQEFFGVRSLHRSVGFQNDDKLLKFEGNKNNKNINKIESERSSSLREARDDAGEGNSSARSTLEIFTPEEIGKSFGRRLSVKRLGKNSSIFRRRDKKSSDEEEFKSRERQKSWMVKLFKWMRKRSDSSSLSDSHLELPIELEVLHNLLPVVLVNPRINIDEVATPECFVGVIMSAFDCLRPYEQLMLKCGSIIGEKFTRTMLNAIMHNPNPLLTAEAVKRLFEMQILCCGSDMNLYEYEHEHLGSCRCLCTLANTDIVDETLPRYSFCRVLLFKYSMFRSTLYELIPLDQKREFHIRAVEFLEHDRIHCSSCEVNLKSDRRFSRSIFSFVEPRPTLEDISLQRNSDSSSIPISHRMHSGFGPSASRSGFRRRKNDLDRKNEWPSLLLPSVLPDFQKCECIVLEADVLRQLISHCVAADLKKKEIEFILHYSALMIALGEFREADKLLGEVEQRMKSNEKHFISKRKERRLFMGKINLLLGQLNLELGALKKASIYLMSALKYFGTNFVPLYLLTPLQYLYEYLVQVLYQNYPRISRHTPKSPHWRDCRAICLSLLSNVFMLQDKWKLARLAALRSLNYLRKNDDNFIELCNAYSNAIDIYRHFGDFEFCRKLELSAAKSCITLFTYKTALELVAIGRLNCSALNARLISGYLLASSRLGESAVKISQSISSNKVESYTISQVAQTMMMIGQLNKAAKLILLLSVQDIWHYILSLEFILETGFVIESSEVCLDAIWNVLSSGKTIDQDTQRRAISVVYVWMSRLGKLEEAKMWYNKLPPYLSIPLSGDTVNSMITILKVLEGDLLILASSEDQEIRNTRLNRKICAVIKGLLKSTKSTEIMLPRFLHLRAFHQYQMNNLSKALLTLTKAKQISTIHGNILERSWISHNKRVWTNTCDFNKDFWTESAARGKLMKWTENNDLMNWKNYMYSLKCIKTSDNIFYKEEL